MGLRMKTLRFLEYAEKFAIQQAGDHEKLIQRRGSSKKGAWTVCRFKGGGLDKKEEGGTFEGVDTPMHTMRDVPIR